MQDSFSQNQLSHETQAAGTTAMVLEIIFGLFGQLGIGHVYAGQVGLGIGLLLGWWVYLGIAITVSSLTGGIGACVCIPVGIVGPILSGIQARKNMYQKGGDGDWGKVALVGGGGCLIFIIIGVVLTILMTMGIVALGSGFNY